MLAARSPTRRIRWSSWIAMASPPRWMLSGGRRRESRRDAPGRRQHRGAGRGDRRDRVARLSRRAGAAEHGTDREQHACHAGRVLPGDDRSDLVDESLVVVEPGVRGADMQFPRTREVWALMRDRFAPAFRDEVDAMSALAA